MELNKKKDTVKIRRSTKKDGAAVYQLIKRAGTLDLNSAYCYLLLCDMFKDTCAVAEADNRLLGFVSAFRRPDQPNTLFIWQIAVDPDSRGLGLGKRLLKEVTARGGEEIRYVEATVSPSNQASNRLFRTFAEAMETKLDVAADGYPSTLFPPGMTHEDEPLLRVGPFRYKGKQEHAGTTGQTKETKPLKEGFGEQRKGNENRRQTVHASV
ncbi:diaminobutyrate acetyltransferase [Paenibacillus tarimensis]|uniref:diaminobutyrate acetyltransferase n=1 Tax=Paenibacillus tarimensis TaxID=416012 RepID=UPI001F4886D5|nr:diaminobutyrate acetyltransferase [Paenibacillus tarimensis]MCF2943732.1 diaminobutyrate acetyltransferase [Paenibacillus tarimensis]